MPNQVQVDFIGNASPLFATADAIVAKTTQAGNAAGTAFTSAFDKSISAVQKQALGLNFTLRQISDNYGGGIAQASLRAQAGLSGTLTRLRQIELEMGRTRDPVILSRLNAEAIQTSANLDRLADKIQRVAAARSGVGGASGAGLSRADSAGRLNLARQAADVFTQLGSGTPLWLIAIQQGPQILDAAAQSGFKLAGAMKAVAGFASAYGAAIGVAGVGIAIIAKITNDIRDTEAQRLKFIENGAAASNRAIIAGQTILSNLKQQREEVERTIKLNERFAFAGGDVDALKRIKDNAQKLFDITSPTTGRLDAQGKPIANPELERLQKIILEANARISDAQKKNIADQDTAFSNSFENRIRRQKAEAEFEREQAAKRIEKAKELNKVTQDFFQSLNQRTNADNPFFKILSDAQELEKQIAKLDPAFQRLARSQASLAAANSLFSAKTENVLGVSDLRQQASFFRNGQRGESTDDLLRRLGLNPDQFKNFTDAQKTNLAGQFGGNQAFQFGRAGVGGQLGGVNVADLAIGAFQNAQQRQSNEETAQQRLDRQFRELDRLTAANDPQRSAIDRRIATLASGIDPTTLRQDTRNRVADSIERNAENLARQQGDATKALQENTAILNRINANLEKQIGITQNGGDKTSVELVLNNQTDFAIGATPTPRNPSPANLNEIYPTESGFFGSGQ